MSILILSGSNAYGPEALKTVQDLEWWDPLDSSTYTATAGEADDWVGKVNGTTFSASATSDRPTIISTGFNFDFGTNPAKKLETTGSETLFDNITSLAGIYIMLVCTLKGDNGNSGYQYLMSKGSGWDLRMQTYSGANTGCKLEWTTDRGSTPDGGHWIDSGHSLQLDTKTILELYYVGVDSAFYPTILVNGDYVPLAPNITDTGAIPDDSAGAISLGSVVSGTSSNFNGFNGYIHDVIMTKGVPVARERRQLRNWAAARHGVSVIDRTVAPLAGLYGQSNMGSPAASTGIHASLKAAQTGVNIFTGSAFAALEWNVNNEGTGGANSFGPELSLAYTLRQAGRTGYYLDKYVAGSTTLAVNWNSTTPGAEFANMRKNAEATMRVAAAADIDLTYETIFWQQGEGDAQTEAHANAYEANFTQFLSDVYAQWEGHGWASSGMTFVAGGVQSDNPGGGAYPYTATVTTAIQNVVATDARYRFASNADATFLGGDEIHFDPEHQIQLGIRMVGGLLNQTEAQLTTTYNLGDIKVVS